MDDGYWWISKFLVKEDLRGMGLAKELAKHLPRQARGMACPIEGVTGPFLPTEDLVRFY